MPQHELLACAQCGCFAFSCFEDFAIRVNSLFFRVSNRDRIAPNCTIRHPVLQIVALDVQAQTCVRGSGYGTQSTCSLFGSVRPTMRFSHFLGSKDWENRNGCGGRHPCRRASGLTRSWIATASGCVGLGGCHLSPCHSGDVSAPRRPGVGERRFAAASDGAEERAPTPTARRHGTGFLGCPSRFVARVGEPPAHRPRGHRSPLASRPIPTVLGKYLAAPPSRSASDRCRDSPPRPHDGARRLGGATHPC